MMAAHSSSCTSVMTSGGASLHVHMHAPSPQDRALLARATSKLPSETESSRGTIAMSDQESTWLEPIKGVRPEGQGLPSPKRSLSKLIEFDRLNAVAQPSGRT